MTSGGARRDGEGGWRDRQLLAKNDLANKLPGETFIERDTVVLAEDFSMKLFISVLW